jgi:tripartite-type tricarboxylate transporter receptor subunit TctC
VTAASYRGTSPALADMMGGIIALIFDPMLATLPQVRGGRVKGVAITSTQRSAAAPDIPTTAEGGMPSLDLQSWWALLGPRGLPAEVIARIDADLATAMLAADVRERIGTLGIEPMSQAGPALTQFMERDFARSEELLRIANFQPQ